MTAPATADEVRVEYALRFPDRHLEAVHVHSDGTPAVPGWAADYGVVLVSREIRRSPWAEVPR